MSAAARSRFVWALALVLICFAGATRGQAPEDYPARPLRVLVPVAPGAGTDFLARFIAEGLQKRWGQPVVVENRTGGAAGNVGAEAAYRSTPDGYTLLVSGPGPLAINRLLYRKLGYDSTAFVPVSLIAAIPNVLVLRPDLAVDGVGGLVAAARANPGKMNYASGGSGTTPHLSGEWLKMAAKVDLVHVPYRGSAVATQSVLSGQTDLMFLELSSALPHIRAGRLRAIAVGTERRNALLPEIPAMSEAIPGFVTLTWYGLVAPPQTPQPIAAKLAAAVVELLRQPHVAELMRGMSIDVIAGGPEDLRRFATQEGERWGKVIRATGAGVD